MERSTFREQQQDGKAWQRLVREKVAANYEGTEWWGGASLSLQKAVVRTTPRSVAEKIILEYEWLGTLPTFAVRFYGIFFDGWACGGVVCFADSYINIHAPTSLGLERTELATLVRGACTHWTPVGTASRLISIALRFERDLGKKAVLAYTDAEAGEIGTIYQACNFICLRHVVCGATELVHPRTGKIYNSRVTESLRRKAGKLSSMNNPEVVRWLKERGWTEQKPAPKLRYLYILARGRERSKIREQISPFVIPYPKRAPEKRDR